MTLVAIYARYSSDHQNDTSIEDQVRLCREKTEKENWTVSGVYPDHAVSGASLVRPGIQMLLQDAEEGKFQIILAEALDRLSRDQADIAAIRKRLNFLDIDIFTLAEGEINELHIGLKGTMNALFLKDLADKTRRGLRGRIEKGKSGGGNSYGYNVEKSIGPDGEPVRGERIINTFQANIVRRIFEEYLTGKSPKGIASQLNKENIEGPSGRGWGPSTIYGNRQRGTGILNNELYIGRMIWNRLRYIKDPDTGKRVSRLNPENEWIIKEIPELRIIDQELWDGVKAKQGQINKNNKPLWKTNRPKNLFSYLLKCGVCGGGFSVISKTHVGCSTARNKGTCANRLTMKKETLEQTVLNSLKNHLMDEDLCKEFCDEYVSHMNKLRIEHNASLNGYKAEYKKVYRQLDKMVDAIADGAEFAPMKGKMQALENRRIELEVLIENTKEAPILFHPNMGNRYQSEIKKLIEALNTNTHREEAAQLIRSLVDRIILSPADTADKLVIDLQGDLAGILSMATGKEKSLIKKNLLWLASSDIALKNIEGNNDPSDIQAMVAGAGFEPATFRL